MKDWKSYPLPASVVAAIIGAFMWLDTRHVSATEFESATESYNAQLKEVKLAQFIIQRNLLQESLFDLSRRLRDIPDNEVHPDDERRLALLEQQLKDINRRITMLEGASL